MTDPLITFAEFGGQIHRSARTAQRIVERSGIPTYRINSSRMVRQSDVDAWVEAQRIEPQPSRQTSSLKNMLEQISAKVIAARGRRSHESSQN